MLAQLLNEIRTVGTARTDLLARRMGTSEELVKVMLDDLKRRGLLTEVNTGCGDSCQGCQLANSCMPKKKASRIWQLTQKIR
mgnify:CR=1 FL=1